MNSTSTKTKAIVGTLVLAAFALFYLAVTIPDGDEPDLTVSGNEAVVSILPERLDEVLAQSEVAIQLSPGWAGRITAINDTPIPYDTDGNLAPGTPNPRNRWSFRPGADKVLERLPTDSEFTCAHAEYWRVISPDEVLPFKWCFSVT